jgi:response regulator RpfG family c-di-GMP phosphodiesterase
MKMEPKFETRPTRSLTILSVSPIDEDHLSLQRIVGHSTWQLLKADRYFTGRTLLQEHDISVVVCERDLMPGTWIDMLGDIQAMPNPPSLIVTSRLADDHLWAEALNLGASDVLAKPFVRSEVTRSVKLGWERWHNRAERVANPMRAMGAAS